TVLPLLVFLAGQNRRGPMRVTEVTDVKDSTRVRRRAPVLWPYVLVMAAWTVALLTTLTNQSYLINHHYLLEQSHLPVLVALVVFLPCWQVMMVGMMLPSSMPMVSMIVHAGRQQRRPYLGDWRDHLRGRGGVPV